MPDAIALVTRSAIFGTRNIEKTEEGHIGKASVAAGQGAKVVDYICTLDNKVGKTTKTAVDALKKVAQNEKLLDYAGKAVNFAAKNINPLICASAGIDVFMSEYKESALVTNATALGAMFAAEHWMKNNLDKLPEKKELKGISEKVMKFARENKCEGKLPGIIHGVAFVVGSCTAYNVGNKFGNLLLGKQ